MTTAEIIPFPEPRPQHEQSPEERPVLVLDLGGQYAQLIARRVRECRVYSELVGHGISAAEARAREPAALILSGGPASVYADAAPRIDQGLYELDVPVLGICYGAQLMALDLGGAVERTGVSEFGKTALHASGGELFKGLPEEQTAWMSHRDTVTAPPGGAAVTGTSPATPVAAFEAPERGLYGVQFHPEVVHTPHGQDVLKNFLYGVAGVPPTWTAAAVIEEQVERVRAQVGNARVLCALSGGVDSSVAALLVHKAVGDQLTCVFVDHGLLRKDEAVQVVQTFEQHFHVPLVHVDAEERFLARLEGVTDPEEKRRRVACGGAIAAPRRRFSSGSVTLARRARKRSSASTCTSGTWKWRWKVWTTWGASSFRSRPWSTETQVSGRRPPCGRAARRRTSRPRRRGAHSTRSFPTWARIRSTCSSITAAAVQVGGTPATP